MGRDPAVELLGSMTSLLRAARAAAHRNSRALGASGTPLGVLKTLCAGDARPGDLAAALHIGPSVVSRALTPLEQQGLVERTTDPADARATLIRLTDPGRARLAALQQIHVDQIREVLADWSDVEIEQAAAMLSRLERAIAGSEDPGTSRRLTAAALLPPRVDTGVDTDLDPTQISAADAALPAG